MVDGPRSNGDPDFVASKLARLREPHIAPLTDYVERLRALRGGGEAVPWFDPDEAGVNASILVLLEAPGPRAVGTNSPRPAAGGSGFISNDNNDLSAEFMWGAHQRAGTIRAEEVVTWNVVPWYVGDGTRIRATNTVDMDEARPHLAELVGLLPAVNVVVLLGGKAQAAWARSCIPIPALMAPHPSPRSRNLRPTAGDEIVAALTAARRFARALSAASAHHANLGPR